MAIDPYPSEPQPKKPEPGEPIEVNSFQWGVSNPENVQPEDRSEAEKQPE